MSRPVELIGAGLSSMAALLWLVYVAHVIQVLDSAAGADGVSFFHLNMVALAILLLVTAALIFALSIGAYLHVVYRLRSGAVLLWISAGLLILDLAAYDFLGWFLMPGYSFGGLPLSPTIWIGTAIPMILPVLEVLATSFAVLAVLASLAPHANALMSVELGPAPDNSPLPPTLS